MGLCWWKAFLEWILNTISTQDPPIQGMQAGGEGIIACGSYRVALDNLMDDPDFINDPNYIKLRTIGCSPGGEPKPLE